MSKVTLPQKIVALICVFTLPLVAITLYFIVSGVNKDIDVAALEMSGDAYQRSVETTLNALTAHQRRTEAALRGDANARAEVTDIGKRVDAGFARIVEAQRAHGDELQFTAEGLKQRKREHVVLSNVEAEIKRLRASWEGMNAADLRSAHEHLIADMRTLITHAGDTSNLILDPDLDSYYLMDATLVALPQTQDRMSAIVANLAAQGDGALSHDALLTVVAQRALMKEADVDRIAADLATSLNEDANFNDASPTLQANLPPAGKQYAEAAQRFLDALDGVIAGKPEARRAALETGEQAIAQSYALWDVSVVELDRLLDARKQHLAAKRRSGVLAALGALLAATVIAAWLLRGIVRGLKQVATSIQASSTGLAESSQFAAEASQELASSSSKQVASMVSIAEAARMATSMTETSAKEAGEAKRFIEHTDEGVAEATSRLDELSTSMKDISHSASKIGTIIRTVEEIAFQTNILALNAAVEAARAGEAGLGFSVVADEVRALSRRSSDAAHDTAALIDECMRSSANGCQRLTQVSESVKGLAEHAHELKETLDHLALASRQQSDCIRQISSSLDDMDGILQRNSAAADANLGASQELAGHSARLEEVVGEVSHLAAWKL